MYTIVTGAAGFIGSKLVEALNREGVGPVLAVDNLENSAKVPNLAGLEIEDYLDKRVPLEYSDEDLKVHLSDGQVVDFGEKVKVSGKVYFPTVDQEFVCALENPLVELGN